MRITLLGPCTVQQGRTLTVLRPSGRTNLLVLLLVQHDRVVPARQLAEELWDGDPPVHAINDLHAHVSRARRYLREWDPSDSASLRLHTAFPGYRLTGNGLLLDLEEFAQLFVLSRSENSGTAEAAARQALALWQGRSFEGLRPGPVLGGIQKRLEEEKSQVRLRLTDLLLEQGRHAEAVPDLSELVTRHPLDERYHRRLIIAYHRSGRPAAALEAYHRARQTLIENLGMEPSPELRACLQNILDEGKRD
ncbi:AfsR/SARP family transcriptional regulator [Streptomyces longwoodensis]|uniref:AfsR/SARP family transcriptional regulator n=1 Tax=Streptomyces longwoodensis TaxID=68231 RepID=UPI0033F249ED